jgi:hypothetical protein
MVAGAAAAQDAAHFSPTYAASQGSPYSEIYARTFGAPPLETAAPPPAATPASALGPAPDPATKAAVVAKADVVPKAAVVYVIENGQLLTYRAEDYASGEGKALAGAALPTAPAGGRLYGAIPPEPAADGPIPLRPPE